jgi:hypothetical protein
VYSYRDEQKSIVVAYAHSASRAEFIQMTLAAHGITATVTAASVYPSVDFVEGRGVSVQIENEARARGILEALGLTGDPDTESDEDSRQEND